MNIESTKNPMPNGPQPDHRRRRRSSKTCKISICVIAILVFLAILFTILALTLFKTERPLTSINSITLRGVKTSFDIPHFKFLINATLLINLSVKNPNRVGFKYKESMAYLRYKDQEVGEAPIEEGEIGAKEVKAMNLTMRLMADRLVFDSDVYKQARSGALPLSTYVEMTGKVEILFKVKVESYSTCDFNVDVVNQGVTGLSCHYKNEL